MINKSVCEAILANESTVLTLPTLWVAMQIVLGIVIVILFIAILAILFDFVGIKKKEEWEDKQIKSKI